MVGIPANTVFVVYKTGMDVLSFDEFRQNSLVFLQDNRTQTLQLAFLLSEDINLIIFFYFAADVGYEQFETFVEYGLGRDAEFHGNSILPLQGNFQKNMLIL